MVAMLPTITAALPQTTMPFVGNKYIFDQS
jgi:hypothetical protein